MTISTVGYKIRNTHVRYTDQLCEVATNSGGVQVIANDSDSLAVVLIHVTA